MVSCSEILTYTCTFNITQYTFVLVWMLWLFNWWLQRLEQQYLLQLRRQQPQSRGVRSSVFLLHSSWWYHGTTFLFRMFRTKCFCQIYMLTAYSVFDYVMLFSGRSDQHYVWLRCSGTRCKKSHLLPSIVLYIVFNQSIYVQQKV